MQVCDLPQVKIILKKKKMKRLKELKESAWSHCYRQTFLRQQVNSAYKYFASSVPVTEFVRV